MSAGPSDVMPLTEPVISKAELHVHSCFSYDSKQEFDDIIKTYGEAGYDFVAVTDHDDYRSHELIKSLKADFIFVPSVEISTNAGHIIGLMVQDPIPKKLSPEETVDRIREQGGFSIVAHPFDTFRSGLGTKGLKNIKPDAIEVFNAGITFGYMNRRARKYADKWGYAKTGGSDSHFADLNCKGRTEIYAAVDDIDGLLRELRRGNCDGMGTGGGILPKMKRGLRRIFA